MSIDNPESSQEFGANEWLVDEMYSQWLSNPESVDKEWQPILERYHQTKLGNSAPVTPTPVTAIVETTNTGSIPLVAKTTRVEPQAQPIPAQAPTVGVVAEVEETAEDQVSILKGMSKTLAANMDASLTIPTATSVRAIPAKLLIDNRIVINSHLGRTRGGKVSFTHIIGYAIIRALKEFPSQNVYYQEVEGKPASVAPANINFGLAIDIPKPDGTRALLVPNIKKAQRLNFEWQTQWQLLLKLRQILG